MAGVVYGGDGAAEVPCSGPQSVIIWVQVAIPVPLLECGFGNSRTAKQLGNSEGFTLRFGGGGLINARYDVVV